MFYTYIIIILLLYIIFYSINQFIHISENYTGFKTPYFFDNLNKYNNIMLEEFTEGNIYRVFIFNNKIIDIIKREKPYIVGNGYDSVEILINKRNQALIDEGFFETKNIGFDYIEKQGFTMRSIVPAHIKVYITNIANMYNGAILERINISSIPHKNRALFLNVGKVLNINYYGIDYLSKDITSPYIEGEDVILEVNKIHDT